jgi:hypothetical protein
VTTFIASVEEFESYVEADYDWGALTHAHQLMRTHPLAVIDGVHEDRCRT